jgi:hypothetical protein
MNGQPPAVPITTVEITKPIVVTAVVTPDATKPVIIQSDTVTNKGMLAATLDLKLDDAGALSAIDADIEDKSGAVTQSIVSAVISVAKIAAVAGAAQMAADEQALQDRIDSNYAEIATLSKRSKLDTKRIEALQKEIALMQGVLNTRREANRKRLHRAT